VSAALPPNGPRGSETNRRQAGLSGIPDHPAEGSSRSSAWTPALTSFAELPESLLAVDRCDATTLEVVIPTVELLVYRRHLFQIAGESIFNDFVGFDAAPAWWPRDVLRQIVFEVFLAGPESMQAPGQVRVLFGVPLLRISIR